MDLFSLILRMANQGYFRRLGTNPLAQFGRRNRVYLGATLLPERMVTQNAYREDGIRYRTIIANDGTRYSPAQKKSGGELVGTFLVELGNSDIAREFTGRDYDALLDMLGRNSSMEATAQVIQWTDTALNAALIELTEVQRWQAIVDASVVRVGDNGYSETVPYPNPSGHRVAAGDVWSDPTYDPWDDIMGQAGVLWSKGYQISRTITSRLVLSILAANPLVIARTTRPSAGRATLDELNALANAEGLPNFETYDLTYNTTTSTERFLAEDAMVFAAETGRDVNIEAAEGDRFVANALGYTAIGRGVGQAAPGRVIQVVPKTDKPPRLEGEAWQTSLPVIQDPESIATITSIE